jgi:hypothetical protein
MHFDYVRMISSLQHIALGNGILQVLVLDKDRFLQDLHSVYYISTDFPDLENFPEGALPELLDDFKVFEPNVLIFNKLWNFRLIGVLGSEVVSLWRFLFRNSDWGRVRFAFLFPCWGFLSLSFERALVALGIRRSITFLIPILLISRHLLCYLLETS